MSYVRNAIAGAALYAAAMVSPVPYTHGIDAKVSYSKQSSVRVPRTPDWGALSPADVYRRKPLPDYLPGTHGTPRGFVGLGPYTPLSEMLKSSGMQVYGTAGNFRQGMSLGSVMPPGFKSSAYGVGAKGGAGCGSGGK